LKVVKVFDLSLAVVNKYFDHFPLQSNVMNPRNGFMKALMKEQDPFGSY